ncbi:baseplate hub [Aeromonas phage GomatiRiver_11]|nr:hypothetical protein OBDJBBDK_00261 [Aeromonas phage AhFM11]WKW84427.1 baseplate hub [Aeromonas phage GomatiRiver_11]
MRTKIKIGLTEHDVKMASVKEYITLVSSYKEGRAHEFVPEFLESRFGKLPKHLAEMGLIKLIARSRRKEIKMEHTCQCGNKNRFTVDPDAIQVSVGSGLSHKTKNGQMLFKLRYPELFEDKDHFDMLDRCIVSVEIDGQQYEWADASDNDKDMVFRGLDESDVTRMIKILLEPVLYVGQPVSCECGEVSPVVITGSNDILTAMGVK